MKQYVCSICGFIYTEADGLPHDGIAPGTKWTDLPDDWVCPICGAAKEDFQEMAAAPAPVFAPTTSAEAGVAAGSRDVKATELNALFSNLSKGCEKQYRPEEAGLFKQLAEYYATREMPAEPGLFSDLSTLIAQDLEAGFVSANHVAAGDKDRGALRALTWTEKVTRMQTSLLRRFEQEQEAAFASTNVFVCEICGFIYVGETPPAICPVCKVPSFKIAPVERR